jgi:hypothetical protein
MAGVMPGIGRKGYPAIIKYHDMGICGYEVNGDFCYIIKI